MKSLSYVRLFATPWTVAHQAPPSMEFSRQQYWSVVPFPSPGDLPDPGIEPGFPALQTDTLLSEPPRKLTMNEYERGLKLCEETLKSLVNKQMFCLGWLVCELEKLCNCLFKLSF